MTGAAGSTEPPAAPAPEAPPSQRRLAVRSLWWSGLENLSLTALSSLTLIVLARLLSPADFGIAAMALAVIHMVAVFLDNLFQEALIQRERLDALDLDTAIWTALGLGIGLAAAMAALAGPVAGVIGEPRLVAVLWGFAAGLVLAGVNGVLVADLRRNMEFRALAMRSLAGRVAGAVTAIALALLGFGVWALVAQQLVSIVLSTAIVWLNSRHPLAARYSLGHLRRLMGYGIWAVGQHLLWHGTARAFTFLVGLFLGVGPLGYLNVATRLVEMARDVLAAALVQVALPMFARQQGDRPALTAMFQNASALTCLIAQPLFAGLLVCAPEVTVLLFGERWRSAAPLVAILSAAAMIYFLRLYTLPLVSALGRPKMNLLANALWFAASIGGLVAFGRHDVTAAAIVWAAGFATTVPVNLWLIRRELGLGIAAQLGAIWAPVVAAVAMAAVLLAVKQQVLPPLSPVPMLAVLTPLGVAAFLALMAVLAPRRLFAVGRLAVDTLRRRSGGGQSPGSA